MPAIVEGDDDGLYVLKFRGAGQGAKALVAELIVGELGRALGLNVPEVVCMRLDVELGRTEPDPEIQDLIKASGGLNLALDYLPGSLTFDPLVPGPAEQRPERAAEIVWLDALATNVDRTPRNPNLLVWHRDLWLIDHGAALFFHHSWGDYTKKAESPFGQIKDHVLLPFASSIVEADARLAPVLTTDILGSIIAQIPDDWLGDVAQFADVVEHRAAYVSYLTRRLAEPRMTTWVREAEDARRAAHL